MKNKGMPKIIEKSKRIRALKSAKILFDIYYPITFRNSTYQLYMQSLSKHKIKELNDSYIKLSEAYKEYRMKVESKLKES